MKRLFPARTSAIAQTAEEWIALGTKVHGGFGAFIPLGMKIGLDALEKLNVKPREVAVVFYDSEISPCACFADGIAIATTATVGQRTLAIAPEQAPDGFMAVAVIRPREGGPGFKYTVPDSTLDTLRTMNRTLDPMGRLEAVMANDDLFAVEAVQ